MSSTVDLHNFRGATCWRSRPAIFIKPLQRSRIRLLIAFLLVCISPAWADADITKRIEALTRQIEQDPSDQALWLQRAMLHSENNQPELGLADVRAAGKIGDPSQAAYVHGYLLYNMGEHADALLFLDRYLKADPQHQQARRLRARLLREGGQNARALADYEFLIATGISLDPGYYLVSAQLMSELPERGIDDALALLDARMEEIGPVSPLQRYAVELERRRENFPAAIARMASLDQRLKGTPGWKVEVAELLLLSGQSDKAIVYLELAQEQLDIARATTANRELAATASRLVEQARQAQGRY